MENSETSQARAGPASTVNQQRADSQETDSQKNKESNDKKEMPEVKSDLPGAIIGAMVRSGKLKAAHR
jgi:biotin carboxyl carrier protein